MSDRRSCHGISPCLHGISDGDQTGKKLTLPYYPYQGGAGNRYRYDVRSFWHQLVSSYTKLDFLQIGELNFLQYLAWRRDAYIRRLEQTEAGREYLENAWRMEQTEPDRAGLRRRLKKGAANWQTSGSRA